MHNTLQCYYIAYNVVRTAQQNRLFVFSLQSLLTTLVTKLQKWSVVSSTSFIYDPIWSDLSMRFLVSLERNPDAEKHLSTCTSNAVAASSSLAMDASSSKTACFCCQKLSGDTPAKFAPAWHLQTWYNCDRMYMQKRASM